MYFKGKISIKNIVGNSIKDLYAIFDFLFVQGKYFLFYFSKFQWNGNIYLNIQIDENHKIHGIIVCKKETRASQNVYSYTHLFHSIMYYVYYPS